MRKIFLLVVALIIGAALPSQGQNAAFADSVFARAERQLRFKVAATDKARSQQTDPARIMPRSVNRDGTLRLVNADDWCTGFFPGELWYMYGHTRDGFWHRQAERNTWMLEGVQWHGGSHDIGFMVGCSFGKGLEMTADSHYRDVLLQAASTLTRRFEPRVGCIRSWSWGGDRWTFPVIIDNMMNLELLFEATRLSGDSTFHRIAVSHADCTLRNHFRPDASSYHVVDYDPADGHVIKRITFQGLFDESVWSRGQAWGLYGYTVCYRYTHNEAYLRQAQRIARFFFTLADLPSDLIPYWDMRDPAIATGTGKAQDGGVACDASAAAIFASGLYELARYSTPADAHDFRSWADRIVRSLATSYMAEPGTNCGFLLQHSTGNHPGGDEIDTAINYADYYFLEALTRAAQR